MAQTRDPGRYEILGEHGRGGLGRVSRAHDRDLARTVAIKELISRSDVGELRFVREVLITARLEHPGIVPVHEAGRWPDGTPFYAMKLVAGRPLRDLIAERSTIDERQHLLHHVIAVADAIAYAHERRIIHRDLKPANVIVGDFGETIVIDWGLAKDLSEEVSELTANGEAGALDRSRDLTVTGSVLGTPAYMAPEQEKGAHVDERADVFAIGAMLWELCSLDKVPPVDLRLRHRALRRAGIDRDLIVIIDRALDPVPASRYPNAGALASDLKAFKGGSHIASRRYSLAALILHWARRHRALTLAVTAASVVLAFVSVLYVLGIADERDRTHRALDREADARHELEQERDALTLRSSQMLLTTDPTSTVELLASYHGADKTRARQLEAEATGRGTATARANPHDSSVVWARGLTDGAIVSLGLDGAIAMTTKDGSTKLLATNVSQRAESSFSDTLGVLAYICDSGSLCLIDVRTARPIAVREEHRGTTVSSVDFSPDGRSLATITDSGELRVLALASASEPTERLHVVGTGGSAVKFIDQRNVAVGTPTGMLVVTIGGRTRMFTDPDAVLWEPSARDHLLALTTTRGEAYLVDPETLKVTDRIKLCHQLAVSIKIIPGTGTIAFACQEGTIGLWSLANHRTRPLTQVEGRAARISVSESGKLVFATGDTGTVTMYDLESSLTTSFRGHAYRVTTVSPPTTDFPYAISGDARGSLRTWRIPETPAKRIGDVGGRVFATALDVKAHRVLASTLGVELALIDTSTLQQHYLTHRASHPYLDLSEDAQLFATYGDDDVVELWSTRSLQVSRTIATNQGAVSGALFVARSSDLVTAGRDGRIMRWKDGQAGQRIASFDQPVTSLRAIGPDELAAVTVDGQAWQVRAGQPSRRLSPQASKVTAIRVSPVRRQVWLGLATGSVIAVDLDTGLSSTLLQTRDSIRDLAVSADGDRIAVAANDETIHVTTRRLRGWPTEPLAWTTLSARGRRLAFLADGELIAGCASGVLWRYSPKDESWQFLSLGTSDLTHIIPLPGGGAMIFNSYGVVYSLVTRT